MHDQVWSLVDHCLSECAPFDVYLDQYAAIPPAAREKSPLFSLLEQYTSQYDTETSSSTDVSSTLFCLVLTGPPGHRL